MNNIEVYYRIKLVVVNEHILGYIEPNKDGVLYILHASILKGAGFSSNNIVMLSKMDKVRLASERDFENFRICFIGYNNPEIYEYDQT